MMIDVDVYPQGFPRDGDLREWTRTAARNVKLSPDVRSIELVFDAPEFEGHGYWSLQRLDDGGIEAHLYGSPRDVLEERVAPPGPSDEIDLTQLVHQRDRFPVDPLRVDRYLHRNLLQLDDLVRGRVSPQHVPAPRSRGLQAVWDVWTDGRLRKWQHPGMSLAERRRLFFRTFAASGLLLPRHWATFHRLWEGEYGDQDGLLQSLSHLPPA